MKINFRRLTPEAKTPTYGTEYSAGADLYNLDAAVEIAPHTTVIIHTGIAMEIPEGYCGIFSVGRRIGMLSVFVAEQTAQV